MSIRLDRVKLITEMARQDMRVIELAEKSGVSRCTITAIRGGKPCAEYVAVALCNALGVSVEEMKAGRD